ncbi:MAG: L,D-transpeptidase family protein [Candidatus Kerfeldbacteria bacterium]|nr:L,D-transpeptidase family protein [Candidatus Kerfeldbacteria bacterium]
MKKAIIVSVITTACLPIAALAVDSMNPEVRVFNANFEQTASFTALDGKFQGGTDVAVADITGDGQAEIIVAASRGGGPLVQVYQADGQLLNQFFAYDQNLRAGVKVAAGDLNKDGKAEIITGVEAGGGPQIRIFNGAGQPQFTGGFFAFDSSFRGGVDVTVGDFNGDGTVEIAAAAGPGGSPHVRLFNKKGNFIGTEFRPFAADNHGGVSLATANVDGGADDELVMSIHSAGEGWVKVYKNNGQIIGEWKNFPGLYSGVVVAAGDVDADGFDEIAVSPRQSAGPQVLFFEGHGQLMNTGFFAYPSDFRGGVRIAGGDTNGDGVDEWVTVPGKNRAQGRADLVRYIETDISEQTTRVYEYGELVRKFKVSTGIVRYPTPIGQWQVLQKIYNKDYEWTYGPDHPDNYNIKNVKWNLRYNGPLYLHYAYWHNNFGYRMSHGCTNIDRVNAEWLYNWAQVGDVVINKD